MYRNDSVAKYKQVTATKKYLEEDRELYMVLSETERELKVTEFYSEIIATHGKKYHPKWNRQKYIYKYKKIKGKKKKIKVKETIEMYNKSERWKNQGLSERQLAMFIRKCYE